MKEILIGLGIGIAPVILTILSSQCVTRKLGRNISKCLRARLGKALENRLELTLEDIVIGMREDNNPKIADKMKDVQVDKIHNL